MHNIYIQHDLNINQPLKKGVINLYGSTGKCYPTTALNVPGYGLIPCSRKLQDNFTTDPKHLVLVVADSKDETCPVTSPIWISYTNTVFVDFLEITKDIDYSKNLTQLKQIKIPDQAPICTSYDDIDYMDDMDFYEPHTFGEFAGSYAQDIMGYDDQTINDVFEGDPDMYWNID